MKKEIILIFFVLATLIGCQYEPSDIYFAKIEKEPVSQLQIDFDSINNDTLLILQRTTIKYNLKFNQSVNFTFQINIGNRTIHTSNQYTGSFDIDPYSWETGYYPITFKTVTNSGTGSLADQLQLEKMLFEMSGVVIQIERTSPQKVKITSIEKYNGRLKIVWEKYPNANFKSYVIYKSVSPEVWGQHGISEQFTINDINKTSFIDTSYLGGNATYSVMTTTVNNHMQYTWGDQYEFNGNRSKIVSFKTLHGNTLEVKWSRSEYYANAKKQWLTRGTRNVPSLMYSTISVDDTVCTFPDFQFGMPISLGLTVTTHEDDGEGYGSHSTSATVYVGEKVRPYTIAHEPAIQERFYFYKDNYLYVSKGVKTDSIHLAINNIAGKMALAVSQDGNLVYAGAGSMLYQLNPETLQIIKTFSMDQFFNFEGFPFNMVVTNDNRLVVDIKKYSDINYYKYQTELIATFTPANGVLTDTVKTVNLQIYSLLLSFDQQHIFENSTNSGYMLKLIGNDITSRLKLPGAGLGFFVASKPGEFYRLDDETIMTYDMTDLSLANSVSLSEILDYVSIDPYKGYIGGLPHEERYYIYNLSGELIKDIALYDFVHSSLMNYADLNLINGYLYSNYYGLRLHLDL